MDPLHEIKVYILTNLTPDDCFEVEVDCFLPEAMLAFDAKVNDAVETLSREDQDRFDEWTEDLLHRLQECGEDGWVME